VFNNKSIYARNKKDPDAIVYVDADGNLARLTRADFASEEEFLQWKAWSDTDYHVTEKEGHIYSDHTLSLYGLSDEVAAVQSPEAVFFNEQDEDKCVQNHAVLIQQVRSILTEKQYRRLWLYYVQGLSERDIASLENVGQQRISKSIVAGKRAIQKYFEKYSENRR